MQIQNIRTFKLSYKVKHYRKYSIKQIPHIYQTAVMHNCLRGRNECLVIWCMRMFQPTLCGSRSASFHTLCFPHQPRLFCKHSAALRLLFCFTRSNLRLHVCDDATRPHGRDTPEIKALEFRYQFDPRDSNMRAARALDETCSVLRPVTAMFQCYMDAAAEVTHVKQ